MNEETFMATQYICFNPEIAVLAQKDPTLFDAIIKLTEWIDESRKEYE